MILSHNKEKMEVTSPIKLEGLKNNLNNRPIEVPIYQREYSWELDQVSDLFYDIENSTEDSPLFLGSLLFYKTDIGAVEIIDGQQRLTTIFLMFYCIRLRVDEWYNNIQKKELEDEKRWRRAIDKIDSFLYNRTNKASDINENFDLYLTTGRRDKRLFKLILQGKDWQKEKDGRRKSHKLLTNAFEFLNKITKSRVEQENIKYLIEFLDKITDCLYISMTANKKEDQRMLFKTLNSRGITLSESDLIKNDFCLKIKNSDKYKDKLNEAISLWDEMREIIEENNGNVDLFLFHYINQIDDAIEIRREIFKKNFIHC